MGIDKSNFYENVLAKSYIDDALYGVPMQYNVQYLYYNKDLFTEAGLDPENPPTTLDELREAAIACTVRLRTSMDWDFRPITVITASTCGRTAEMSSMRMRHRTF